VRKKIEGKKNSRIRKKSDLDQCLINWKVLQSNVKYNLHSTRLPV